MAQDKSDVPVIDDAVARALDALKMVADLRTLEAVNNLIDAQINEWRIQNDDATGEGPRGQIQGAKRIQMLLRS